MGDGYLKKCSSKRKVLLRAVHSAKKTKTVLICVCSYSEFQILDLDTGELSKTSFTLLGDAGIGTIVSIGSVIYTIGKPRIGSLNPDYSFYHSDIKGENDRVEVHEGMSYFDLNNPELGWKKGPLLWRITVFLIASLFAASSMFLEVLIGPASPRFFDPNSNSNSWDPLPLPSPSPFFERKFEVSSPALSDPLNNRILVQLDFSLPFVSSIYAYYPADSTWECLVENFDGDWTGPIVFVDGVIYFYTRKSMRLLRAYDLHSKQWLKVLLSSDFEDCSEYVFDALHHLGNGLLCFTTYFHNFQNIDPSVQKDHTAVVSIQFKVQRTARCNEVLLTPVSTKSSAFESYCQIYGHIAI